MAMTEDQIDELEVFVNSSRTGRQMSYFELARIQFRHWNVSEHVVRRVLRSRGYERCIEHSNYDDIFWVIIFFQKIPYKLS